MFAGSCIGVIGLVIALEFVRRAHREYDALILNQWRSKMENLRNSGDEKEKQRATNVYVMGLSRQGRPTFYPNIWQQAIRALFYAAEVGAAYITMLLIMSYNGYIFFCILIGYLIGYFLFSTDTVHDSIRDEAVTSQCC
jgi:copper transporter 1